MSLQNLMCMCEEDYIPFKSVIYGPDMNITRREPDIREARNGRV